MSVELWLNIVCLLWCWCDAILQADDVATELSIELQVVNVMFYVRSAPVHM